MSLPKVSVPALGAARGVAIFAAALLLIAVPWAVVARATAAPATTPVVLPGVASVAYRSGGHFQQANDSGKPAFWEYCGGTVAVNTTGLTADNQLVVELAARDFTAAAAGHWAVVTTPQTEGAEALVVVKVGGDLARAATGVIEPPEVLADTINEIHALPWGAPTIQSSTIRLSASVLDDTARLRTATLHELGHAVGADHSDDPDDVMFPSAAHAYQSYTAVEAAGIRKVSGRACS